MSAPIKLYNPYFSSYFSDSSSDEEAPISAKGGLYVKVLHQRLTQISTQSSLSLNDQIWLQSDFVKNQVAELKDKELVHLYDQVLVRFNLVKKPEEKNSPSLTPLKLTLKLFLNNEMSNKDMFWILVIEDLVKLSNDSELIEIYNQVKAKIDDKELLNQFNDLRLLKV